MNSGIWMFWLVNGQGSQGELGEIGKWGKKWDKKLGQKLGGKKWAKNWAKNRQKCDHTNSGRQFVVIEFTNLVEFMNVIE